MDLPVVTCHCVAENRLDRQFETAAPNTRWVTDFTYVRTQEGWLYATVVMDLFSRRVFGWSLSSRHQRSRDGCFVDGNLA